MVPVIGTGTVHNHHLTATADTGGADFIGNFGDNGSTYASVS